MMGTNFRLQNLHTHSKFCDGADELEDIVLEAIAKGFDTIGFSSHSFTPFDESYCMTDTYGYVTECERLCKEYKDKITVLCGLEQDYFAPSPTYELDYIIDSVHYIKCKREYIPVDESPEILINAANRYFKGDIYSLCEEYYKLVGKVANKTGCDIIGHFDLISKFCETAPGLIDFNNERIIAAEQEAIEELIPYGVPFEVNTGAMARGLRTSPYPSQRCLEKIAQMGGSVILTSDCHSKEKLDFGFEDARDLIQWCGFRGECFYRDGGFQFCAY